MQPNPHPTALDAPDDSFIAFLMMLLRALIAGHLPHLPALADASALPHRNRRTASTSSPFHGDAPAAPIARRERLECVLVGPAARGRPIAMPALGWPSHPRGATSSRRIPVSPPSGPPRPRPRSRPPPPDLAANPPAPAGAFVRL